MKLVSLAVRRWSSNYTAVVVLSAEVYVVIARSFYQFIKFKQKTLEFIFPLSGATFTNTSFREDELKS